MGLMANTGIDKPSCDIHVANVAACMEALQYGSHLVGQIFCVTLD